jgi:hypothetical protein
VAKVANGDQMTTIYFNKRKNYYCQLLKAHGLNKIKQTDVHIAEVFLSESVSFKIGIAHTKNLKRYKSPGID